MKLNQFIIFGVFLFCSCHNKSKTAHIINSDTTIILYKSLSIAVDSQYLPSTDPLFKDRSKRDTIYFTSRSIDLKELPDQFGSIIFKKVNADSICRLLYQIDQNNPRSYLSVNSIIRNDSGYYVQLSSLSCQLFGGGGQIGIYFKKQADTFVKIKTQATSIN